MTLLQFKQNSIEFGRNLLKAIFFAIVAIVIVLGALPHFGGAK